MKKSVHVISGKRGGKTQRARGELNAIILRLYRPYLRYYPQTKFANLLTERYGVNEARLMSLAQLENLVNFMEAGIVLKGAAK